MFSGVHYATVDYMVYIQDGWITFAYWKPQFVKDTKTSDTKFTDTKSKDKSN